MTRAFTRWGEPPSTPPIAVARRSPAALRRGLLLAAVGLGAIGVAAAGSEQPGVPSNVTEIVLPPATDAVSSFNLSIPQGVIDDLRARLAMTRWPNEETVGDWSQGEPLEKMKALADYWRTTYDMRRLEQRLNAIPQYRTRLDGLGIHFLHVTSKHPNALPLIMTHGWPGSVVEFLKVLGPLTDPTAHGGKAEDAFHVVAPSLPGYGFSDKPTARGWGIPHIAKAWAALMKRLGYASYVAQGGDWGAGVTTWMAKQHVEGLMAVHLNLPILFPPPLQGAPGPEEKAALSQLVAFGDTGSAYARLQSTRPQTLAFSLADSPVGQAAWIYEKLIQWADPNDAPGLSDDEMLDNIMLYWLANTGASSARLYFESFATDFSRQELDLPVAVSVFPGETYAPPKVWADRTYSKLVYWNVAARGGHFAAFEQPDLFVTELRNSLAQFRRSGG
jgi:pimeloyl-ACP methyl ester carboxylesterase